MDDDDDETKVSYSYYTPLISRSNLSSKNSDNDDDDDDDEDDGEYIKEKMLVEEGDNNDYALNHHHPVVPWNNTIHQSSESLLIQDIVRDDDDENEKDKDDDDDEDDDTPLHTSSSTTTTTMMWNRPFHYKHEYENLHPLSPPSSTSLDPSSSSPSSSSMAQAWNTFTWKYQGLILLCLPFLFLARFYFMPRFTQYTDSTFHPVPGSLSAEAIDIFRTAFALHGNQSSSFSSSDDDNDDDNNNNNVALSEQDPMNPGLILVLDILDSTKDDHDDDDHDHHDYPIIKENRTFTNIHSPIYNATRYFALHIQNYIQNQLETTFPNLTSTTPISISVSSYYSYQDNHLTTIGQKLVTANGKTTVLFITFSIPGEINKVYKKKRAYIDCILDTIQEYGNQYKPPQVHIGYTGLRYFDRDIAQGVYRDLQNMDLFVIPLALIVLSFVLGGTLAVIIPIITLVASVSVWSIVMAFIVQHIQITQITPTVMMSLTLGIGLDYSLFLLSRLFSELNDNQSTISSADQIDPLKYKAIGVIIQYTGGTILASGTTLALTFLGMLTIPLPAIQSIAIGATVAIASTILCNLTFIPALMHTPFLLYSHEKKRFVCSHSFLFDLFYSIKKRVLLWYQRHQRHHQLNEFIQHERRTITTDTADSDYTDEYVAFRDLIDVNESRTAQLTMESYMDQDLRLFSPNYIYFDESILSDEANKSQNDHTLDPVPPPALFKTKDLILPSSSIWVKISFYILKPKYSIWILMCICILLFPLALKSRELKLSLSMNLILPQGSPSFETFNHLGDMFGSGTLSPYRLIFDGSDAMEHMDSETGFENMHQFLQELTDGSRSTYNVSFVGIAWSEYAKIPFPVFKLSRICSLLFHDQCPIEVLKALSELDSRMSSPSGLTTFVTCILPFNAFSDEGVSWLKTTREKIQEWHSMGRLDKYKIVLEGEAAIEYDALEAVYTSFPKMIAITSTIIFFILYLFSRSIIVPVRSICSISLTLFVVYGFLVLVYQDGILNRLQISSLHGTGEISWLAPILAFSVTIGLGLDYDLFVTSRILELRMQGYSHTGSIAGGLYYTGKIVTAAGIIMAIAFGGLLMSTSPILNQWSFLLTSAVLVDTFIVRTIIVPILIEFLGDFAWWPIPLPKPQFNVWGDESKL